MDPHLALYVRIPQGLSREQFLQRVREALVEAGPCELLLYRLSPWVEVRCGASPAFWHTAPWLSGQLQGEVVALAVQAHTESLHYQRAVGGRLVRELELTRSGDAGEQGELNVAGAPETWEAEALAPLEAALSARPWVWARDAREGERQWKQVEVPAGSAGRAAGTLTRVLGLPLAEGALPGDGVQESVFIPAVRPGVEERGHRPPGAQPPSALGLVGLAAVVAAFVWMAVAGVTPIGGGTWAALPLAWVGYIALLRRHSGVIAFGGGFIATCLTLVAAIPFSRLLH